MRLCHLLVLLLGLVSGIMSDSMDIDVSLVRVTGTNNAVYTIALCPTTPGCVTRGGVVGLTIHAKFPDEAQVTSLGTGSCELIQSTVNEVMCYVDVLEGGMISPPNLTFDTYYYSATEDEVSAAVLVEVWHTNMNMWYHFLGAGPMTTFELVPTNGSGKVDLAVSINAEPAQPIYGSDLQIYVVIDNWGTRNATRVVLMLSLPGELKLKKDLSENTIGDYDCSEQASSLHGKNYTDYQCDIGSLNTTGSVSVPVKTFVVGQPRVPVVVYVTVRDEVIPDLKYWDNNATYTEIIEDPDEVHSRTQAGGNITQGGGIGSGREPSPEVVIGSVISALVVALLVGGAVAYFRIQRNKKKYRSDSMESGLEAGVAPKGILSRSKFVILDRIGEGCFGTISRGCLYLDQQNTIVAVKQLKSMSESNVQDFMYEAKLMLSLDHVHVVKCMGYCLGSQQDPCMYVLLEYMEHGDLATLLKTRVESMNPMTLTERTVYCYQLSQALAYLASQGIVHRDIAARNVLVDKPSVRSYGYMTIKIGDFGLSFKKETGPREKKGKGASRIPLKWTAPEAIRENNNFTTKSDVWSFGVTMWEIFSDAATPYSDLATNVLLAVLDAGMRLQRPDYCPLDLYEAMRRCWTADPNDRPTFTSLVAEFGARVHGDVNSQAESPQVAMRLNSGGSNVTGTSTSELLPGDRPDYVEMVAMASSTSHAQPNRECNCQYRFLDKLRGLPTPVYTQVMIHLTDEKKVDQANSSQSSNSINEFPRLAERITNSLRKKLAQAAQAAGSVPSSPKHQCAHGQ
eukprot:comp20502_c1_seq1/m.26208 comp20502_c1_seq1/g.26208  ORF comp20502_c1_seq1/g.26208 comp20502_c1_seq1/m.26208 type:complete len:795 (-) comp20502_c1_seq1:737-3121(-)